MIGNGGDGIRDEKLNITFYADNSNVSDVDISTYLADNTVTNNAGNGYYNYAMQVVNNREGILIDNVTLTAEFVENLFGNNGLTGIHSEEHAIKSSLGTVSNSGFTDIYTGNTIEGNHLDGIYFDSAFTGGTNTYMDYSFVGNQINNNGRSGLYAYIDPSNGCQIVKTLLLQENTIATNSRYGAEIYVNGDSVDDFSGDFGGGLLGSSGGNTFADNSVYDIYHRGDTGMNIWALSNSWTDDSDPESTIYDSEESASSGNIITSMPD